MGAAMSDAQVWAAIQELTAGSPDPAAVVDAVARKHGLDRDRVAQVWRERSFMIGGG